MVNAGNILPVSDLALFLDTNALLHYPPIRDVDWKAVCGSDSVRLVLCLQVIHELDEKKSDHRLGERAGRTIREIKAIRKAGGSVREGVSLEVFNYEVRAADFPGSLSYDSKDDRIVHSVKKYLENNANSKVAVYSEDMGMSLRCEANSISVLEPDPLRRLANPQDELARKHKQAVQELDSLKHRKPKLLLSITQKGGDLFSDPPTFEVNDLWKNVDVDAELAKQHRQYPNADEVQQSFGLAAQMLSGSISEERWAEYDEELEEYFEKYRKYIDGQNILGSAKARCIIFDLVLKNDGNGLATDIDVVVSWPQSIRWIFKSGSRDAVPLEKPIDPPEPPEVPQPRFVEMISSNVFAGSLLDRTPPIHVRDFARRDEFTPETSLIETKELTWEVHVRLQKLKHGHNVVLGTFLAVFSTWDDAKSFSTKFSISTADLSEKIEDTLPILVRRASEKSVGVTGE
jgi:hypothetical protein